MDSYIFKSITDICDIIKPFPQDEDADPLKTKQILLNACDRVREDLKLKGIQLKVSFFSFSKKKLTFSCNF